MIGRRQPVRPRSKTSPRRLGLRPGFLPGLLAVTVALAMTVLAATAADSPEASRSALEEGNRLFHEGRFEEAVAAYLEGNSTGTPHPTLLYNLGTALHHAGRLPEAILWYRRAVAAGRAPRFDFAGDGSRSGSAGEAPRLWHSDDPWLEENLWLARRSLGSRVLPPAGLAGWLAERTGGVRSVAIAIAWLTLAWAVVRPRTPVSRIVAAAIAAVAIYGGAAAIERWGPRPAVLLEDCLTDAGELPAGTEAWVLPADGDWSISGTAGHTCPTNAIGLVSHTSGI